MSAATASHPLSRESIAAEQLRPLVKSSVPIYTAVLAAVVLRRQIEPLAL